MTSTSTQTLGTLDTTRWLRGQSNATKVLAVLFGTLVLTASSHVSVPMVPVPMTMQTLAVTLVGGAWLAAMVGVQKAIAVGVAPFVLGGVLKSVLGAALLKAIDSGTRKAAHR